MGSSAPGQANKLLFSEAAKTMSKAIASAKLSGMRKSAVISQQEHHGFIMEAERINAIGNTLEDLTERTADLRRYL
nr:hypothetical protein [Comamonas testosteroni]